jgi:hypothetical protein
MLPRTNHFVQARVSLHSSSTAGFSGHDPYRMMRMCGLDVEPV